MEEVVLVDEHDNPVGTMEKMAAHRQGLLHRAFSVVLFNSHGELLLQKRAAGKYHSSGLWTNTCCSHPLPGEPVHEAARRRLRQEMGIDLQPEFAYTFIYRAMLDNDLTEYELDHVLIGTFDGTPMVNPHEVSDWKFMNLADLHAAIKEHPEAFTAWFKIMIDHPQLNRLQA